MDDDQDIDVGLWGSPQQQLVQVDVDAGLPRRAEESPAVAVEPRLVDGGASEEGGIGEKMHVEHAEVTEPETVTVIERPVREITVGVLPVWGYAVGWILVVIAMSQASKWLLRAAGAKKRLGRQQWKAWMMVLPAIHGTWLAAMFGPQMGALFGLRFGLLASVTILGPGSGAAAAFCYDIMRRVVLPILPSTVVQLIERVTGVTLPDEAKSISQLIEESESEES